MIQAITAADLKAFEARFDQSPVARVAMNAVVKSGVEAAALSYDAARRMRYAFSLEIDPGELTNQKSSGRCWMFAALNTMRYAITVSYTHLDVYKRQGEGQPFIYYACGESVERIGQLPQIELVRDKGYDILCLTEDVDEFALKVLGDYGGKEFKSVAAGDPVSYTHLDVYKRQNKAPVGRRGLWSPY